MAVSVSPYDNAEVWGPVVVVIVLVLANLLAWALNEQSWPYRHLLRHIGLPKLLFISNRAEGVERRSRPRTYWTFDLLDPHHLVQSPVLNTAGLLVLHAATFLYWVATVLVDVVVEYYGYGCTASWCYKRHGAYAEWMTFLTNWSISILGLSGLVAFINTARYARQQRHARAQQQKQQQQHSLAAELTPQHSPDANVASGGSGSEGGRGSSVAGIAALGGGGARVLSAGGGQPDVVVLPQHIQQQQQPGRDQGALPDLQQQQQQKQQQQRRVHQQGEPQQPSAASSGRSSSSSSSSSCDTVVVVQQEESVGKQSSAQWDWLSLTHCLLSEVATTAAFFVSFWFWIGLVVAAKEFFRANGGTLMAHAGNLVMALLQLLLTRLPVVSTHFQVLLWYASLYEVFVWAYGGGSGTWRYGLDWQKAKPAGALMLVPLVVFIFFCIWFFVARLREALITRLQSRRRAQYDRHKAAQAGAAV